MRAIMSVAALGLAGCGQMDGTSTPEKSRAVGRWALVHSPHAQRDTMLLDTVSGRTWALVSRGDENNPRLKWVFVGRLDQSASEKRSRNDGASDLSSADPDTDPN